MRWEDLNLKDSLWFLPDTKNNSSQTVVIPASHPSIGLPLTIFIRTIDFQTIIDDVRLSYVPEPSTALLMGLGLVGLSVRNRRKV